MIYLSIGHEESFAHYKRFRELLLETVGRVKSPVPIEDLNQISSHTYPGKLFFFFFSVTSVKEIKLYTHLIAYYLTHQTTITAKH